MNAPATTRTNLNRSGFAVVTSLLIVLVVGIFILGSLATSQIGAFITRNDVQSTQAQYVAVAGLQAYRTALFQNYRFRAEQAMIDSATLGACGLNFGATVELDMLRTGATSSTAWNVGQSVTLAQGVEVFDAASGVVGTYEVVILKDSPTRYVVVSRGRSGTANAEARAALTIGDSGVLEQAIFTGDGSQAKSVNGNITVYGGVYVEGKAPASGQPKPIVLSAGGNFAQLNSYNVTGQAVANYLDETARKAADLCATLRVLNGRIELTSGSAALGAAEPDTKFPEAKSRLHGVFVDEGSVDILGAKMEGGTYRCHTSGGICADQVQAFDLDRTTAPRFPKLDVKPQYDGECTTTWRSCILDEIATGGLTIGPSTLASLPASCQAAVNATTKVLTLGSSDVDCTSGPYGFKYKASTGHFEVYGTVQLQGFNLAANVDLKYKAASSSDAMPTERNATLFLSKDALGNGGSFALSGGLRPDEAFGTFPSQVLGIIAEQDFTLSKQTEVFAPVYTGGQLRITQQSKLFGSAIVKEFCTTSAGGTSCNAGQAIEVYHVSTRANRPSAFAAIQPDTPRATFFSLGVEVN